MRTILMTCALLLSFGSFAQYYSYGYGAESAIYRGETDDPENWVNEPGFSAYVFYNYWLANHEQLQLSAMADVSIITGRKYNVNGISFEAHSRHISPLLGIRYYFDQSLNNYEPEIYQDALFVGVYSGALFYQHNYGTIIKNQENAEETFPVTGSSLWLMGQLGYRIYINNNWAVEVDLNSRFGWNDHWDGYTGTTGVNDWIFQFR